MDALRLTVFPSGVQSPIAALEPRRMSKLGATTAAATQLVLPHVEISYVSFGSMALHTRVKLGVSRGGGGQGGCPAAELDEGCASDSTVRGRSEGPARPSPIGAAAASVIATRPTRFLPAN